MCGLLAIEWLERFVQSLLFDVSAAGPWVLVGAAAAAVPTWRVARIQPVSAMRTK